MDAIQTACNTLPAGRYAVGISGGADSTALLLGLHQNPALNLHAVHLNHQTRGGESDDDADFVRNLAARLNIACTIASRCDVERTLLHLPKNPSARYRAVRLALFGRVVEQHDLAGVILAHHGDDQAETVLFRLLRGSSVAGLVGMSSDTRIRGIRVLRPFLSLRKCDLQAFLTSLGHPWREDASNFSPRYARNRLRVLLCAYPALVGDLLALSSAARSLQSWTLAAAPRLGSPFSADELYRLPSILARQAAGNWLVEQGMPPGKSSPGTIDRLLRMCSDAATPPHQQFPGALNIVRRRGQILADPAARPGDGDSHD
jgi:tRNA(Ile)-lysidine synthetase-like protein